MQVYTFDVPYEERGTIRTQIIASSLDDALKSLHMGGGQELSRDVDYTLLADDSSLECLTTAFVPWDIDDSEELNLDQP